MNNYPELPGQHPTQPKLVLPGHPENTYQPTAYTQQSAADYTQRAYVHPDQFQQLQPPMSGNPITKLGALWRRDPAYRVLMVAATMVLIAGIISTIFLMSVFAQAAPTTTQNNTTATKAPTVSVPATTPPPTFPTPSGGQGSTTSSQPPPMTPVTLPTLVVPITQPTQITQGGGLTLQITDIAQQVRNNSTTPVTVTTTQPGVKVYLQITFDQASNTNTTRAKMTNNAGTVTFNWHVTALAFKQQFLARVTAIGVDQNGQQQQSQTVTIQVTNNLFG